MSAALARHDIERFRAAIGRQMGLQFDDNRLGFLGEVLQRRLAQVGHATDAYLGRLECVRVTEELNSLAQDLTVGETYFFRNIEQFRALADIVVPLRLKRAGAPILRLLSAGCASGEEAYSMAIVAREAIVQSGWMVDIRGVDINQAALQKARRARYSAWALRETPPEAEARWFSQEGDDAVLAKALRDTVEFELGNLAGDDPSLWQAEHYDVIFCRNVLMYFSPGQMRASIDRIARSLAPGGFLFLGHAETLRGISDRFHLHHSHGTFYYQLKADAAAGGEPSQSIAPRSVPRAPISLADRGWYDAICQATERVTALMPGARSAVPQPTALSAWDIAPAFDLLREERFDAALNHIRTRPAAVGPDAEGLLLEATLLVHAGQPAKAADTCQQLLLIDEFNAGAHYLLALCCEQTGQPAEADKHDRVAAYLDPQFAMPRMHRGLRAGRTGDRDTAREELEQALILFGGEDSSRLLMFGGGFGREALVEFCRAALREHGGRS